MVRRKRPQEDPVEELAVEDGEGGESDLYQVLLALSQSINCGV